MNFLGFLAPVMGTVMRWIYLLVNNYGITIILFTIVVRLLMFPLSLKQQKSQAKMAAYQPMIQEIQKKWANDKQRQQQEVMKFQEENNMKMTEGCLPMVLNMVIMFSIIVAIYAPMQNILRIDTAEIDKGVRLAEVFDPEQQTALNGLYTKESILIGEITEDGQRFIDGADVAIKDDKGEPTGETEFINMKAEDVQAVQEFRFDFFGLNLARVPKFDFSGWDSIKYLILPILSLLTMVGSMFISTKSSGQTQGRGSMWIMTLAMSAFFGWYAFTVPVGFSLYYTISNIVMAVQQMVTRKIYNPEKFKEQIIAEMEARKQAKKAKKVVTIQDASGQLVKTEMSEAELAKLRLAKARELDAAKYAASEEDETKAETARQQDEVRYGKGQIGMDVTEAEVEAETDLETTDLLEQTLLQDSDLTEEGKEVLADEVEMAADVAAQAKAEHKPGRRKRARQNKSEDKSFAEQERAAEEKDKGEA